MAEGSDQGDRSTERSDPADHYATAARAVEVMGVYDARTVQKWMARAGVAPWGNYGYPIADLVRVINSRRWPGKRELRPEHFRVRIVRPEPRERSTDQSDPPEPPPTLALAIVPPLLAALETLAERSTALAEQAERLAAGQAELAAALERERAERSADRRDLTDRLDALAAELADARRPWWARLLGRR